MGEVVVSSTVDVLGNIERALSNEWFGNGPRAELRRLKLDTAPISSALHRVLAEYVPSSWVSKHDSLQKWAAIVHFAALLEPLAGQRFVRLGAAVAEANVSEDRLTAFLRARPDQMLVTMARMVKLVISAGIRISLRDLTDVILADPYNGDHLEKIRSRIAADYYRVVHTQSNA